MNETPDYSKIIHSILAAAVPGIKAIGETDLSIKPSPEKWSKKEILGHLVDSAINNLARFVNAQKQDNLVFSGYDQVEWVIKNHYQEQSLDAILNSWVSLNSQIAWVVSYIPKPELLRETIHHNFDQIGMFPLPKSPSSLSWLIEDYIAHLEHHLAQIIPDYNRINPYSQP